MIVDTAGRARTAERAARRGARVATRRFRTELAVETKDGPTDYVTDADRAAEAAVLDTIGEAYPGDRIIAEERTGPEPIPEAGPVWVVDPIDGTSNFVRGSPVWATSVAAVVDGETVAGVRAHPWDTVAGVHLVRTAGGRVTDPDGGVWHPDSTGLVASNGHLHADVAAVLGGGRG